MRVTDDFLANTLHAYPITGPFKITEVTGVHASRIYHLQSPGSTEQFALRITRDIDEAAILNELHITSELSDSPLQVAEVLRTAESNLYVTSSGHAATLRTWISGTHPEPGSIASATMRDLGRALAVFHTRVSDLPYPNTSQLLRNGVDEWRATHLAAFRESIMGSPLWKALDSLEQAQLPTGVVHGDFHALNLLVDAGTVGVLDLERSGEGVLIYDIARATIDLCSDGDTFDPAKSIEFIQGYESVRELSSAEKSQYPAALAYAALAVSAWFYQHNLEQLGDHFVDVGESALNYKRHGALLFA